ncbi:MAG TPA: helix-turn-helix domain-containing protein, partial [archaeon]|nr:helix-turn-helix domain-containing protein [archaeon]
MSSPKVDYQVSTMDITILEEAGLTEKEAKLYLALLESGPTTTGPLIKRLGLHKATVYALLERLKERGLVSSVIRGRTQQFQATEPQLLLDQQQEREERLKELLPELQKLRSRGRERQSVTVYEGKRATRAALTDFFSKVTSADIHRAFIIPKQDKETNEFFERLNAARSRSGARAQYLFSEEERAEALRRAKSPHTEVKLLPSWLASPAVVNIFKDTTLINLLAAKDPLAIVIESAETADAFKKYFEALWDQPARVYRGEQEVKDLFYSFLGRMKPGE